MKTYRISKPGGPPISVPGAVFTAAMVAAAFTLGGCESHTEPTGVATAPTTVRTEVEKISPLGMPGSFDISGVVKAHLTATLSSKVSGTVKSVLVREGDTVKQGQVLVEIDSRELQAAVNVSSANYRASVATVGSAETSVQIESETSKVRVQQAEFQVKGAISQVASATARLDLVLAGPRRQEVSQSHLAVEEAKSNLDLQKIDLDRTRLLVGEGALPKHDLDTAENRYQVARSRFESLVQAENIAMEGARTQEISVAREGVKQAKANLDQARSAVVAAKASQLQVKVRLRELEVARAQTQQSAAALDAAQVSASYSQVTAPFNGRIVQRLADPGTMAGVSVPLVTMEGGDFQLDVAVPESFVGSLKLGTSIPVRIASVSSSPFPATVRAILPQGNAASHIFTVELSLAPRSGLKAGMYGRAQLATPAESRILIPSAATWEKEGLHYVFAVTGNGIARLRIVTLGDSFGANREVLSGLSPGDQIVIGSRDAITDGVRIEAK